MPEDLFDGVLGGEEEKSDAAAPEALAGAEAFAAATASRLSGNDPGVARKTEIFLEKQALLLDTQRQHLQDEHASRLIHLRLTVSAAKRKRYADYMRNGFYTCIALIALGVLLAGIRMIAEAMSDHSLVVEDFSVPSDFAARGVTPQALAEDLASRVAAIRATTNRHSLNYTSEVRADQAGTLKVQIPETGISIDELERFLHRWLGHQTVVNGELREEVGGAVSLILHIAGADPIVVSGTSTDLDLLVQAAAEKAFAVFSPGQDVVYLGAMGRVAEAYTAAQRYVHGASVAALSARDQAGDYSLLAAADPDPRRALSEELLAIDADPPVLSYWIEAPLLSLDLGHDQAAVDFARKWVSTERQDQPASQRNSYAWDIAWGHTFIDQALGDFAALRNDYRVFDARPGVQLADRYTERAQLAALLHDETAAQHELALALTAGPLGDSVLQARWDVSSSAGDWPQALDAAKALVAQGEAQKAAAPSPEFAARPELELATQYRPWLAYAEAMTGDAASATVLISQTPMDCYLCVRTRAKIAAVAGDAATADHWFAEAMRQAPDLPMAYYEWGQALLARGNLAGAARELELAHEKGPHFADPLKDWGDVLAKQGHLRQALAKYDEALKYAPNWAALKQARDAVASKQR
jgi:tetratricopeptide (TPR) repeat protein